MLESKVGTRSGKLVDFLNPSIEDLDLYDMAYALSNITRFNGHSSCRYSVAQHSVLVSRELRDKGYGILTQFWGLIHDCSEAYIADIPAPLKPFLPNYIDIENRLQGAIYEYFNVPKPTSRQYKPIEEIDHELAHLEGLVFLENPTWVNYKGNSRITVNELLEGSDPIKSRQNFILEMLKLKSELSRWCDEP